METLTDPLGSGLEAKNDVAREEHPVPTALTMSERLDIGLTHETARPWYSLSQKENSKQPARSVMMM